MDASDEVWHVIERNDLMDLLERAYHGEPPDMIYMELYVNGEHDD